jgi:plasmid rolling circle replication initiator protein Rep
MRRMLDNVKYRYEKINRPIRGYVWALELKENEGMQSGYHIHYHLVVAVDRFNIQRIPNELKFEDLWGQRTGIEFIKKSVRSYLSKYLYKSDAKILGRRSYAISRKLF